MIDMKCGCDRSMDVAMATDFSSHSPTFFFVAVCNKLCAVIHDNTNKLGNKHCPPPGNGRSPSLTHFLDIRMRRDTTRCANAAWTHENQLTDESTIINRRGGSPDGLQPGFALHLVIFAWLSTGCTVWLKKLVRWCHLLANITSECFIVTEVIWNWPISLILGVKDTWCKCL